MVKMESTARTEATTTYSYPLESKHFSPTTSHVTIRHLPKTELAGNKAADGTALNTGLSVWFGAENMIENIAPVLDECGRSKGALTVLELGAGTGLTGLFVMDYFQARGECVNLDLTDGIDEALDLLETNVNMWVERGGQKEEQKIGVVNVTVSKNWFGQNASDGGFSGVDGGYDLVYGADLVYERKDDGKVQALASTVLWMLSGEGIPVDVPSDGEEIHEPPDDMYLNELTFEPRKGAKVFVLSFTRRTYPLVQLVMTLEKTGLKYEGTLENSCYDLFGNQTCGLTEMWRDCVLVFSLNGI